MAIKVMMECDVCADTVHIDPETYKPIEWKWMDGIVYEIDVCPSCINKTWTMTAEALVAKSRVSYDTSQHACNECDRSFDTQQGLSMHIARSHKGTHHGKGKQDA